MSITEVECLELARQGNQKAFTEIVESYQNPVYNLCYRMLGNPQAAEDAAQETFARACCNLQNLKQKDKFPSWLAGICRNIARVCVYRGWFDT